MDRETVSTPAEPVQPSIPLTANPSATSEKAAVSEVTAEKDGEEPQYLGFRALCLMMASLILVILIVTLDASIIATAIPRITDHFHTIADIGWYGAAYLLSNAALQPLTGKVYTYFSLKYSFVGFVALFEVGSLICALATSSSMLVVGRAVAGMGGSGLQNGALTIIAIAAPPHQRPTLMGVLMSMAGAGQLIGPLIGGALTQHASWRWCFWINLPVGAVTCGVLILIQFPPYKARKANWTLRDVIHDFDITGFAIFAPACIMLLLALQWGGTVHPWSSATVIGLLCGSGGAFIVFFLWEVRQKDAAMIPMSLMRRRVIYSSMLTAAFQFGGLLLFSYYLPLWFQVIRGASPTMSAVYILPTFFTQILSAIFAGVMVTRIGYLAPFSAIGSAAAAIGSGLMSTLTIHSNVGTWIGYQIINGIGRGMSIQQPIQAAQAVVSSDMIPTVTASVAWAQTFGAALFLGLAQTVFLNLLRSALRTYAPEVDAQDVIATGATNYLARLTGADHAVERNQVLEAYNEAITHTFYLAVGCGAASFVTSLGIGKTRVERRQKKNDKEDKKDLEKGHEQESSADSQTIQTGEEPGPVEIDREVTNERKHKG